MLELETKVSLVVVLDVLFESVVVVSTSVVSVDPDEGA